MELVSVEQAGPHLEEAKELFAEYWSSFGFTPCFQGFDRELHSLPGAYGPPRGSLLVAPDLGCVALRPVDGSTAELKRLYVRPRGRGRRLGWTLASAAIAKAGRLGYRRVVLDTLPGQMAAAVSLYRSLGFRETAPYLPEPTPGALCLELLLR